MNAQDRRAQARAWLVSSEAARACRVKLCGMFREADMDAVERAAPDMCGFIVDFPRSHRSVDPARLSALTSAIEGCEVGEGADRHPLWRVGVFVDKPVAELAGIVEACGIDVVQLHGFEDAAYLDELRQRIDVGIIQAFAVKGPADVARAQASSADLVLLDAGQGSGQTFDWSLVAKAGRPFLLAGGLGPETVARAVAEVRPWGVDMSSGIETDTLKDPDKMAAAVAAVRIYQNHSGNARESRKDNQ